MVKKYLILALILMIGLSAMQAQENKTSFWKWVDSYFGLSSTKNIDTNYYVLAPKGWMVNVNNSFAGFMMEMDMEDNATNIDMEMSAISAFNYQIGATAGYRNLILGYSFATLAGDNKDMTLQIAGNKWGVEYRHLKATNFTGEIDDEMLGDLALSKGDMQVQSRYLRSYYVFNSRRFSTTAALDQRCIQRKSAGSLLFYSNYVHNAITPLSAAAKARMAGASNMEFMQGAVGLGYAYNYTPNNGRLLLHASVMPMLIGIKSAYITTTQTTKLSANHNVFLNCMARLSVNYRFNDNLGVGVMAFFNNINFAEQEYDMHLTMNDYLVKATLCVRF